MAANNQIEVTLVDGFLNIKNATVVDAIEESYALDKLTSIIKFNQDYTAINAYQPGRFERDLLYQVILDFEEAPTDLVQIKFDIQDVTNQAGWTSDLTGLQQAIDDIKAAVALSTGGGATVNTTIGNGRKVVTTAGTAVTLAASTVIKEVTITAEISNTSTVVVGGSGVIASLATRQGTPLEAGDSATISIDDLSKVYIDALVNGEGVTFTYLN